MKALVCFISMAGVLAACRDSPTQPVESPPLAAAFTASGGGATVDHDNYNRKTVRVITSDLWVLTLEWVRKGTWTTVETPSGIESLSVMGMNSTHLTYEYSDGTTRTLSNSKDVHEHRLFKDGEPHVIMVDDERYIFRSSPNCVEISSSYTYRLVNGQLLIDEREVEVIRCD